VKVATGQAYMNIFTAGRHAVQWRSPFCRTEAKAYSLQLTYSAELALKKELMVLVSADVCAP